MQTDPLAESLTHPKARGLLSGTINMGHPNQELKHPQHAQNKIRHMG